MIEKESNIFVPRKYPQILASLAAAIGAFALGNVVAWTSPALPDLKTSVQFHGLTDDEISWIASLVPLGGVLGGPIGGYLIDRYGRQLSTFLLGFPFTIGWLLISFAQSVTMMCIGRFITGICGGAYCLVIPIYLSEIPEEGIRGIAGSAFATMCSLGVLFTYVLGSFLSWKMLSIASTCIPLILLICIYFAPESPIFLLSKGKRSAAGKSLMRLRGTMIFDEIEPELKLMESSLGESGRTKLNFHHYIRPEVLKPFGISLVLMVVQQCSGINAVIFYTVNIFQSAGSDINPNLASIIVAIVLLIGILTAVILIDKAGRRALLLISEIAMTICLLGLGLFFYLKSNNNGVSPENLTWLPLVSLMVFSITFNMGVGPLAWLMMAELLPSHVKGTTSAVATSFNWFLGFLVTKFFIQISAEFGMSTCYFIFAVFCALGAIFIYFVVPETKGKTFDEIKKHFL